MSKEGSDTTNLEGKKGENGLQESLKSEKVMILEENVKEKEKDNIVIDGGGMEDDDDDDDDDEEDEESTRAGIQLGFVEKEEQNLLFLEKDWRNWDGGKVGGLPVWLDHSEVPTAKDLLCSKCSDPLCFLLEIYCPLDNIDAAFHRVLYFFCCKRRSCLDAKTGMKCIRSQLPRSNNYYPYEPITVPDLQKITYPPDLHFCRLCGCKATNICSSCKKVYYCTKHHQKLHWKAHKKVCRGDIHDNNSLDDIQQSYLFPESTIIVTEEEPNEVGEEEEQATIPLKNSDGDPATNPYFQNLVKDGKVWEDAITTGDHPEEEKDRKLTQKDYNQALSEQIHDPIYIQFLTRIDRTGKKQVLRYCDTSLHRSIDSTNKITSKTITLKDQHHGRLFATMESKLNPTMIPPCEYCGGPRAFECQIMPQLLYYLQVDRNTIVQPIPENQKEDNLDAAVTTTTAEEEKKPQFTWSNSKEEDLNWGLIDVFTCINSCEHGNTRWKQEYIEFQSIPDK